MKCTVLLIKVSILVLVLGVLSACASKSSMKNGSSNMALNANSNASSVSNNKTSSFFSRKGNSASQAAKNVNDRDKQKYKLALIYLQDGELILADKALKDISQKYPNMAGPIINRGIIAMKEGRWEAAEKLFSNAQMHSPRNPIVLNFLGVIYRQQGKFSDAKTIYLKAIEQDDKFANAYLNLGILFDMYLSDYQMAKKYYLAYQSLSPDDAKVNTWLLDIDQRIQASN